MSDPADPDQGCFDWTLEDGRDLIEMVKSGGAASVAAELGLEQGRLEALMQVTEAVSDIAAAGRSTASRPPPEPVSFDDLVAMAEEGVRLFLDRFTSDIMSRSAFESLLSEEICGVLPERPDAQWCAAMLLQRPDVLHRSCGGDDLGEAMLDAVELTIGDEIEEALLHYAKQLGISVALMPYNPGFGR